MPSVLEVQPRSESRSCRLGRVLARRRAVIFAPLFAAAVIFRHELPRAWLLPAAVILPLAFALRLWATGYRTWLHGSGAPRYLMSAGPYAYVRHPLYVANGVAGAAALVLFGRLELLAVYSVAFVVTTAFIVLREERALALRFGSEHRGYRATVPAFCPLPGRAMPRESRRGRFSWQPVRAGLEAWKLAFVALLAFYCVAKG
ncbi:MAG TPA: methyltransferase [Planctomycetota bacterium]|nr:methyltransferase [Planctomycetota bacterium]